MRKKKRKDTSEKETSKQPSSEPTASTAGPSSTINQSETPRQWKLPSRPHLPLVTQTKQCYIEERIQRYRLGMVSFGLLGEGGLKLVLLCPNPRLLLLRWFETFGSMRVFYPISESTLKTIKSWIRPMMGQRWGLDSNTVLWHLEIPRVCIKQHHWNTGAMNTTSWTPNDQTQDRTTLMCLSIGTPENNKFSICSKWKIHYF